MKTDKKTIGKRIQLIRLKQGKNTREFGELFDPPASDSIVSRWEAGKSLPNAPRLKKIAGYGQMSIEELLLPSVSYLIDNYVEHLTSSNKEETSKKALHPLLTDGMLKKQLSHYLKNQDYSKLTTPYEIKGKIKRLANDYMNEQIASDNYLPFSDQHARLYAKDQLQQALQRIEQYFFSANELPLVNELPDKEEMVREELSLELYQNMTAAIRECIQKIDL